MPGIAGSVLLAKWIVPVVGATGIAGFVYKRRSWFVSDEDMVVASFLKKDIATQRELLRRLVVRACPPIDKEFEDCSENQTVSSVCEVCLEDVSHESMSLMYSPCGHRCVCDNCDRDIIVIKLCACVEQTKTIPGDTPIIDALKALFHTKALAATFPRTDRCFKCNKIAERQYTPAPEEEVPVTSVGSPLQRLLQSETLWPEMDKSL